MNRESATARKSISLVLGSGGARGYAHIGVIEELLAQGYEIRSIAGSSMGALVGGVYAAGKLDEFRDWTLGLARFDVFKLLDTTLVEAGSNNTFLQNDTGLAVSMNDRLALKVGYQVRHNSDVTPGTKKTDTLLTTNLVFKF